MSRASGIIPSLLHGVSQQPSHLRLPGQVDESSNCLPSTSKGLVKRPRTNHQMKIPVGEPTFSHFILRDDAEKYVVTIWADGSIRIWDFAGNEKVVTNSNPSYLAGITGQDDVRAVTIMDKTFIVNRNVTVAMNPSWTFPARPAEALVHVITGNYLRDYTVSINNGAISATYRPKDGAAGNEYTVDTSNIASHLFMNLTSTSDQNHDGLQDDWYGTGGLENAPWGIARYAHVLHIDNSSADFSISTSDGFGNRAMVPIKGSIQKFSDLPTVGPQGFVVKVVGDAGNDLGSYWVKFEKSSTNDTAGVWKECPKPGALMGVYNETMPHALTRNADGTFTFAPISWKSRVCGDDVTNPQPSFVGRKIQDVFMHKNRLGFIADENVIMSESGEFYNFWRTTLTALLDTDPIDVAAVGSKVTTLRAATSFQRELVVFSDTTQYALFDSGVLTPKSASLAPLTSLDNKPAIRPVEVGSSAYFVGEKAAWAEIFEYELDRTTQTAAFTNITGHAPQYIPAGVHRMIGSPNLDMLFVATSGSPSRIYFYKFYWQGNQKLQSAWQAWYFGSSSSNKVLNMVFDKGRVWLLMKRGSETCLEYMYVEEGIFDWNMNFMIALDRCVDYPPGAGFYNAPDDRTWFPLPYAYSDSLLAVTTGEGSGPSSQEAAVTLPFGGGASVPGDWSGQGVKIGIPFRSFVVPSTIHMKSPDGKVSETHGRLTIKNLSVNFSDTGYFTFVVTPQGRATMEYPMVSQQQLTGTEVVGAITLATGHASFPVMSRNDRASIRIENATWQPFAIHDIEWRGTWNPENRER